MSGRLPHCRDLAKPGVQGVRISGGVRTLSELVYQFLIPAAARVAAESRMPALKTDGRSSCDENTVQVHFRAYVGSLSPCQSSTARPATRENSPVLFVTKTRSCARAVEAIIRSFGPIGRPSRWSWVRTTP